MDKINYTISCDSWKRYKNGYKRLNYKNEPLEYDQQYFDAVF